jgi:hypothetical protein
VFHAKNAVDLEIDSEFHSAYRNKEDDISRTRSNWLCSDFKKTRIVPRYDTDRTRDGGPGAFHLKSWLVDTWADGNNWREVAGEQGNNRFFAKNICGCGPRGVSLHPVSEHRQEQLRE